MRTAFTAVCVGLLLVSSSPAAQQPTRADYDSIHLGMTRADVEAILGLPGEIKPSGESTFLTWGEAFRSITVQLVEGKVISKSHFGLLREADPGLVTRANFDLVTRGMTRAEVEAILGPGDDASVSRDFLGVQWYAGMGTAKARWITVGFMDGRVIAKSQKGLD